jgi:hypothetical protein
VGAGTIGRFVSVLALWFWSLRRPCLLTVSFAGYDFFLSLAWIIHASFLVWIHFGFVSQIWFRYRGRSIIHRRGFVSSILATLYLMYKDADHLSVAQSPVPLSEHLPDLETRPRCRSRDPA